MQNAALYCSCGLFYVRKIDHTLDFCEWAINDPYQIPFRDTLFTASREIISSKVGQPISISILPHHIVARQIEVITPCMLVAHPLSGKTGEDKKEVLSRLGLWMI